MTVNNMQSFKCKIVSGTRILIKLFLVVSYVLLSACHIEDQKVTSEKESDQIEYSSTDSIDTYTFNLVEGSRIKGLEIVYAECDRGKLIEKESRILEVNNNNIMKLSVSKTGIDISYCGDNKDEKHIQFASSLDIDTQNISYTLKQDRDLVAEDILLYLDAVDMISIQSEVNKDWTKFEGSKARAVILRFTK